MKKPTLKQQLQNQYDHVTTIKKPEKLKNLEIGQTITATKNPYTGQTQKIKIQALTQNQNQELLIAGNHTQ